MYKNIKRVISLGTIIVSLVTIEPLNCFRLETKAYAAASTYKDANDGELTSLEIKSANGQSFDLLDNYDGDKTELTNLESYYIKGNVADNKVVISATVKGTGYVAKVFESDRANATGHDLGEKIDIVKGKTILYVRTFTSEQAYENAQKHDNITGSENLYKIYINNTASTGQDKIYLDRISIDGNAISTFDCEKLTYDVSVKEDEDTVEVNAYPDKSDYLVKINDNTATEENKYTRKVNLKPGKNQVQIRVQDDNAVQERVYTLNIYRGIAIPKNNESSSTQVVSSVTSSAPKVNQWVQANNFWQYNDASGNPLKNTWFHDNSNGYYYFLQENGALATGWLKNNGQWYYLNALGVRQTGWQAVNGKWYYLNSDGSMAYNTTIGGYKLGSDGAWMY